MKISLNWLKDYIDVDLTAHEIAKYLTEIGLEVGKVEKYESIKGGLEGLVIGKVLTCEKHPNADKLYKTTVDIGNGQILPIVCGAPNVAVGQKVIVATVGTKLYKGEQEWEIKKTKIRGEVSEGMICAEDEIGLGDSHDGIMVLPDDVAVGTLAKDYFDVYEDWILEVDITPNRQDAFSHYGVARDLYAYLKVNTTIPCKLKLPEINEYKKDDNALFIDVEVRDKQGCPRYSGVTMTNVKIKPSPKWMQNRLKAIGLKPINNVVDITNYVLHEIGHPLHAFDAYKIAGNKIIVSTVNEGTPFILLDGSEIKLTANDLMICDGELKPMCMGGIMGGLESGINEQTTAVFIESAFFDTVRIRKSSKYHQLNTDSSFRFERGVDPNSGIWALKRCALLIKQYADAKISSDIVDVYPQKINNFRIFLTYAQLNKIAGFTIDFSKLSQILEVLEIKVLEKNSEGMFLEVPTYRFDVRTEIDVIEDILRIYGYNNIPQPQIFAPQVFNQPQNKSEKYKEKLSNFLTAQGFFEIMTFSLYSSDLFQYFDFIDEKTSVKLLNPLSKLLDTMRQTLVFGALDTIRRNIYNQNSDIKTFEFGSTYFKNPDATKFDDKYTQNYVISLAITGLRQKNNWIVPEKNADFFTLKTFVEAIFYLLNVDLRKIITKQTSKTLYNFGIEYYHDGKLIAHAGLLTHKLLKYYDIHQEVYYAEIDCQLLYAIANDKKVFQEYTRFPRVKRDLSMILSKNIQYSDIEKIALQTDSRIIALNIFDVYEGQNIGAGNKSYAISYYIQDTTHTLTDDEIDEIMNKLINNYEKIGIKIRK